MKFTKTQLDLIERAQRRGKVCVLTAWGTGPQGGRVSMGGREDSAARKLVAMGIFKAPDPEEYRLPHRHTRAGCTVFSHETTYELVQQSQGAQNDI